MSLARSPIASRRWLANRDGFGREISRADTPRIHQGFTRIGVDVSSVPHDFCLRTVSCSPPSSTVAVSEPKPGSAENNVAAKDPEPENPQAVTAAESTSVQSASAAAPQTINDRYRDGIIIWETPADAKVPFLLKFTMNTQLRYLNTQDSDETFTDHLGVVHDVHPRNDITVNRAMFIFSGYIFDPRARYSFTVWTSAGSASVVIASNIGWQFNKALAITGGYTGIPGSRSLVNTFPFFTQTDRSMADNFFRPGFTQGVWASGEPVKGLNYMAFVGNGLNTINISANKIDTHLACFRQRLVGTAGTPMGNPANLATCTTIISRPRKFASEWVPRIRGPGRTGFQISINQVPRTRHCTIPTAC